MASSSSEPSKDLSGFKLPKLFEKKEKVSILSPSKKAETSLKGLN